MSDMFCPKCGDLSYPSPSGEISCKNWRCGYEGPATLTIMTRNEGEIDLSKLCTTIKAEDRFFEVHRDSENMRGVLTVGACMCPKCDSDEIYSYLEPLLDMAEVQVAMLTCGECGFGWREH